MFAGKKAVKNRKNRRKRAYFGTQAKSRRVRYLNNKLTEVKNNYTIEFVSSIRIFWYRNQNGKILTFVDTWQLDEWWTLMNAFEQTGPFSNYMAPYRSRSSLCTKSFVFTKKEKKTKKLIDSSKLDLSIFQFMLIIRQVPVIHSFITVISKPSSP